jgi:CheY-like chemotaxis protein/two-component sensor histidine kinase
MALRSTRVDMRAVVDNAVEGSQPALEAGRHRLHLQMPDEEVPVFGDPARLAQALGNILNNAAKYTAPGGSVDVQLARVGGDAVVTVTDTGVGIPAPMLDRVFDLFAQVHHTPDRTQGGLGIGLSLVRSLVALHGGSVVARSAGADQGSAFEIRLPATATMRLAAPPEAVRDDNQVATRFLRIMVVDDNVDAADSLSTILALNGHDVRVEYSAVAALAAVEDFEPDVIFCDIGMPGVNGHEFAHRVRRDPHRRAIRLVAVTGWGAEEDRRRSRAAGFDHHMTKPVSIEAIESFLAQR